MSVLNISEYQLVLKPFNIMCHTYLIAQCRGRVWIETIDILSQLLHRRRPYDRAMGVIEIDSSEKGNMEIIEI